MLGLLSRIQIAKVLPKQRKRLMDAFEQMKDWLNDIAAEQSLKKIK